MNREWYVIIDGRQMGPMNSDKVQGLVNNGVLKSGDMLWREGMANWHTLKELMKIAQVHKHKEPNHNHQISNKFQTSITKYQTNNQEPQEIFPLPKKSIALATASVFVFGLTLSAYWFSNRVNSDLNATRQTIVEYKNELDKVALRASEADALSAHLKTLIAQISQQFKNTESEMLVRIGELKTAVESNNSEKFATKDDAKDIKSAITHIEDEQKGLVVNFKSIESALESLAEKVLDMKMAMSESTEATPKQPIANKPEGVSAEEYFSRGNKKYGSGDFKGAIDDYSKAVEINPSYAAAFDKRGSCVGDAPHLDNSAKLDPAIKSKTDKFVQHIENSQGTE